MAEVLVTIPAYNEQESIATVIRKIQAALKGRDYEIVVMSDGSTDKTVEIAEKAGAIAIRKKHGGLADTFRYEMIYAIYRQPKYIVHIDADGQYSAWDIPKLLDAVDKVDLVLGSRVMGYIEYMPFSKRLFNFLGAMFFSIIIGQKIWDVTTGLRAFNLKVAALTLKSDHTYTVEQLIKAKRAGFTITSVPASFYQRQGNSRLIPNSFNYLWRTVRNLPRMLRN